MQDWVQVSEFAWDAAGDGERDAVRFALTVAGEPSGEALLEVVSGVPVVRRQVVQFPDGEMRVTETYRSVNLRAATSPGEFATSAR